MNAEEVGDDFQQHDDVIVKDVDDEPNKCIMEPHVEPLFEAEKHKEENKIVENSGFDVIDEEEKKPDNEDNISLSDVPAMFVDTCATAAINLEEQWAEDNIQYYAEQQPIDVSTRVSEPLSYYLDVISE